MRTTSVATGAFIKNGDTVLIAKRSDQDEHLPGHWELVGGKLEWGESLEAGLAREVREEAGLEVKPVRIYNAHHFINEEKERYIIEIDYLCELAGSDIVTLSHEHSEYQWITQEQLASVEPMHDVSRLVIQKGFDAIGV